MRWALFALIFVADATLTACGGDTSDAGACAIAGCGGDIEGTWDLTVSCIKGGPATNVPACDPVIARALETATIDSNGATLTFSNGMYTETGTMNVKFHYGFTNACLTARGGATASDAACSQLQSSLATSTAGAMATCTFSSGACECDVTTSISVNETGTYRASGSTLILGMDTAGSPFCVHGDTAQVSSPPGMGFSGALTLTRHP